jgi:hypothetical protein
VTISRTGGILAQPARGPRKSSHIFGTLALWNLACSNAFQRCEADFNTALNPYVDSLIDCSGSTLAMRRDVGVVLRAHV